MATLLTTAKASAYLLQSHGVSRSPVTLKNLRLKGGGPPFRKFGSQVYYTEDGLDAWVASKLSKPLASTSDPAA